jgi:dipeptidyl aminopeptidase/acylaminoacyl peptidase
MTTYKTVSIIVVSLLTTFPCVVAANETYAPLPADKLLSIGSVISGRDAPQWSPDGERIMFMSGLRGGLNLMGIPPDGGFPVLLTENISLSGTGSPGSQKPQWSPDGKWIGYVSSKGGAPEIWLWSIEDGCDVQLTDLGARVNAFKWSPDSKWIVFSNDRYGSQDIWKVSVPDGKCYRLTSDDRYDVYPTWTPDGNNIIYVRMDERWVDHDVFEMPAEGGRSRLIVQDKDFFDYRAGLSFGTPLPSPDEKLILFRSLRSGWHNFWVVPRAGGEPRAIASEKYDQSHARWSPDGRYIAYLSNHNGTYDLRVVPTEGGEPRILVTPEGMGALGKPEWSPDGTRISYTMSTPTRPEDLYVVNVASGKTERLTDSMTRGLEDRLVVPEKVSYPSTDGLTIQAYLYLPPHRDEGERFPGVLWIHGGPTSQFDDGFGRHRQVQFFVQRGYVVLLPNVRGSSGYGKAFEDANNGCWGRCDMEDVRAGVDYLKTLPYINPDKMGITGTSYGGIMSMAAVSFTQGLFQAAIPISGYGDMSDFHTEVPELQHIQLLNYELGPYPENKEVYDRHSSILHAQDATTPALILHGQGARVPWRPGQRSPEMASLNFARALDRYYKIFRYKSYPGETYYVYGRPNTKQKLHDMLEFFDQFLKDEAVTTPSTSTN